MNKELQKKCDLMAKNFKVCAKSAKGDLDQAKSLAALLLTEQDEIGEEDKIRAARKLLKQNAGPMNNMRGYTNLALLAKMSMMDDPEPYLADVFKVYDMLKGKIVRSTYHPQTAQIIVENCEPQDYETVAKETLQLVKDMRERHPLITSNADSAIAALLVMNDLDTEKIFEEAEKIYQYLEPCDFKFKKGALQTISLILALSDKPVEEKCEKFKEIRQALIDANRAIKSSEQAVLAAFVDSSIPVETIVQEVSEIDDKLKKTRGYGRFAAGANLRRLYACALVLQVHSDELGSDQANAIAQTIVQQIITVIVTVIVVATVSATAAATASSAG